MEAVSDSGLAAHVSEDKLRHWGAADVAMAYEENIRCHIKKKLSGCKGTTILRYMQIKNAPEDVFI
jgi:hypothetical protein